MPLHKHAIDGLHGACCVCAPVNAVTKKAVPFQSGKAPVPEPEPEPSSEEIGALG